MMLWDSVKERGGRWGEEEEEEEEGGLSGGAVSESILVYCPIFSWREVRMPEEGVYIQGASHQTSLAVLCVFCAYVYI